MVRVAPAHGEALQVAVAFEVAARHLFLLAPGNAGEDDIDETEGDLDAVCQFGPGVGVSALDLERGDRRLMPVLVLRMEERGARRVGEDEVPLLVQDLLRGVGAVRLGDSAARARRDLAARPNLHVSGPDMDVRRRETNPLSLL